MSVRIVVDEDCEADEWWEALQLEWQRGSSLPFELGLIAAGETALVIDDDRAMIVHARATALLSLGERANGRGSVLPLRFEYL